MPRTGIIVLAVLALALVTGCGRSTDKAENEAEDAAVVDMAETAAADADLMATAVEADGTLGCGHCTYHKTDSCALAMETDEGDVVLLDAGERQEELMAVRYDQPSIHVEGKISEVNGQKIIYAETLELQ